MSFRIDVELIYDTLFLTRWELNPVIKITDAMNHGYGYEFEKAFTALEQGLQGSSGHYRIVQYDLGGIRCLVRCETDAFLLDGSSCVEIMLDESDDKRPTKRQKITDTGAPAFSESQALKSTKGPVGGVKVVQGGRLVSCSSIIEIKSCNKDISHKMREVIPQLWFSQTAHLFIGRHKKGLVANEVKQVATGPLLQKWEMEQQDQLKTLVALIGKIKNAASSTKAGKVVLLYDSKEKSQKMRALVSNGDGSAVSKEVKEMCWGKLTRDVHHGLAKLQDRRVI